MTLPLLSKDQLLTTSPSLQHRISYTPLAKNSMGEQQQQTTLEHSCNNLSKLAWLSACLSLLIGLSHVRSFPSYNVAVSIIALYASSQDEVSLRGKSIAACCLFGASSILFDVAFCILWASEVSVHKLSYIFSHLLDLE